MYRYTWYRFTSKYLGSIPDNIIPIFTDYYDIKNCTLIVNQILSISK